MRDMEAVTPTAGNSFTEFVRRVEPRLRIALMAGYGPERGREAAAEALAYAWEHWDRVGSMEHPVGFLYRVGQSKTRTRRRPRLRAVVPEQREPWFEPGLPDALRSLSRRQRLAVVLVHAYGWSQREAADLMGVAPETVRTHLGRGLTKLRAALEVDDES
jgi:DNA-directed RNA polymerase specialized sigma24 family protein